MKIKNVCLSLLVAGGIIAFMPHGADASPLRDVEGNLIPAGSSIPFSMKQSCAECHISRWTNSGGRYERSIALARKDHGPGTLPYDVPYPQHGVTAGYHFQQGRNVPWGDVQRSFYNLPDFTSSPGMYGKY